jgi:hypothetical protein
MANYIKTSNGRVKLCGINIYVDYDNIQKLWIPNLDDVSADIEDLFFVKHGYEFDSLKDALDNLDLFLKDYFKFQYGKYALDEYRTLIDYMSGVNK